MQYVNVRNLEKYHPGYKDRDLRWAKIYFNMVQGDPDCEMIENEIDWGRLVKLILLQLQAKKPIPLDDAYLRKKGFDLKKRPMSLTLKMLQNFVTIVTEDEKLCGLDKDKEEDKDKDSNKEQEEDPKVSFDRFWNLYDKKVGKPKAFEYWKKLTPEERIKVFAHTPEYKKSKEKQYMKDPERYLKHKTFNDEIISVPSQPKTNFQKVIENSTYKVIDSKNKNCENDCGKPGNILMKDDQGRAWRVCSRKCFEEVKKKNQSAFQTILEKVDEELNK